MKDVLSTSSSVFQLNPLWLFTSATWIIMIERLHIMTFQLVIKIKGLRRKCHHLIL